MAMDPPDPHEVPDFKFKALRRIRLGDDSALPDSVSLVGVASKIGLVAVGGKNCVYIMRTVDIEAHDTGDKALRAVEVKECPKVTVRLPGPVIHVAFSCDSISLAVVVLGGMFPMVYLYDTRGLAHGDSPYQQVTLDTTSSGVSVTSLCWNPAVNYMFIITFDDGSIALYSVKDDPVCLTHPPAEGIIAVSWSPKGKQLVAARRDGRLTQYKPDLKEAKTIPGPPVPGLRPTSILWVSTYEFLVAYIDTTQEDARPGLWLVKGSKAGAVTYANYDDICYSTGEGRKQQYSMVSMADWGMIVAASSGSMEVGVIGQEAEVWSQWLLEDAGRAELPLTQANEDRFPTGFALDFCSTKPTPMEEGRTSPPSPILHVLSTDGLLCSYYCVNTRPGAPALCAPPEQVSMEGRKPGTVKLHLPEPVKPTPVPVPVMPTPIQKVPISAPPPPAFQKPAEVKPLPFKTPAFSAGIFNPDAQSTPLKPLPTASKPPPTVGAVKPLGMATKEPPKPIIPLATPKSIVSTPKPVVAKPLKVDTETEAELNNAIAEELGSFQQELERLRARMKGLNVHIGNTEDKVSLKTRTEAADKFCKDVIETTAAQNVEIHALRSDTLEAFAWLEEARSRDIQSQDVRYLQLLRARRLDPVSQRKSSDLNSQFGYIGQQLTEANALLDSEWEDHVGNLKKGVRGDRPARETIYKVLLNNHNIMEGQRDVVGEITEQVKKLRLANITASWSGTETSAVLEEDNSAEKELEQLAVSLREKGKIAEEKTPSKKDAGALRNTIVSPVKPLTPEKDSALRNFLDNRPLSVVKTAKPASPSKLVRSSPVQVPSSKLASLLKDATPTPPKQVSVATPVLSKRSESPPKVALNFSFNPAPASVPSATPSSQLTTSFRLSAAPPEYEAISPPASPNPITLTSSTGSLFESLSGKSGSVSTKTSSSSAKSFSVPKAEPSKLLERLSQPLPVPSSDSVKTGFSFATNSSSPSPFEGVSKSGSSGSLFGGSAPKSSGSLFGSTTAAPKSSSSLFGSKSVSASPKAEPAEAAKPSSSLFSKTSSPVPSGISITKIIESASSSAAATTTTAAITSKPTAAASSFSFSTASSSAVPEKTSSSSSLFGAASSTPSSSGSPFGGSAPKSSSSLFGSTAVTATSTAETTKASVFGGTASSTPSVGSTPTSGTITSKPPAFGGTPAFGGGTPSSAPNSVFGGTITTTKASVFGGAASSANPTSVFGGVATVTTSASAFGGSAASTATTKASVFGGSASAATTSASVFGGSAATTTTSASVFGSSASAATTSASVFGGTAATSAATSASVFGGTASAATPSASVFGGSAATSTTSASVFGGTSSAATPSASVFGGTSASTGGSLFGVTPASGAAFGGTSSAPSSSASVFGASTTSSSVFGGSTTSVSAFGGTPAPTSASSVFGATPAASSGFGAAPAASSGFGAAPASSANSVFGGAQTGLFGSTPATSSSSVFGNTASTASSVFGAPSVTTTPAFGSAPSAAPSTFGAAPAAGSSIFGGSTAAAGSVFGGGGSAGVNTGLFGGSSGVGGGGFLGGLGSSAPAADANKNPFGGGSSFGGSAPPSGGIFGGSSAATPGASVFGGGGSGAGTFTTGGGVGAQGFASPTKPASGFGAAPAFGSPPAFGGSAAFGAAPAFGSGAAFGGGATFGSAPAGGSTFGSSGSAAFGTGAAESAPTFGSVAQTTGATFGGFGAAPATPGGSAFGGGGTFGGGGGTFGGGGGPFGGGGGGTFGADPSGGGGTFGVAPSGGGGTFGAPPSGGGSAFGGAGPTSPGGTSFNSWR